MAFYVHAHSACAFIQDGVGRFVIDESAHGHSLFLTTTKNIVPIILLFPAAFSGNEIPKFHIFEELEEFVISGGALFLLVWVNKLITKRSLRQVWSLWDVEDLFQVWLVESASCHRPEFSHDSE